MIDTKAIKPEDNQGGTFTQQLTVAEVTTAYVYPVPSEAPGVITAEPGTANEEAIYYKSKDDGAGTISGLTRDFTNLNGGTGIQHENGEDWEVFQSARYITNIIDILDEGFLQEQATVAKVDASNFTVVGNVTVLYNVGRVVRANQDNNYVGTITAASYSAGTGLTTVTITGFTVPTLTSIEYGLQPKTVVFQQRGGDILDSNGNEAIKIPATASAVNELTATNAATGGSPQLAVTGDDTNIDMELAPKGTGTLKVPAGTYEANVTDDDDIPNKKYIDNHALQTSTHGVSGSIVGTTDSQTITNKDLSAASNILNSSYKKLYAVTTVIAVSSGWNTFTHNQNTSSQIIFAINGDYSSLGVVVNGIQYVNSNSFKFYVTGSGTGRFNFMIVL